jgi:hypothetical protein
LSARRLVAACQAFIGVSALGGGYAVLGDAEGMGLSPEWLAGSPFADYRVPGLFLMVVLGVGMLAAAVLTLRGHRLWPAVALAMGVVLGAWLAVETAIIGLRGGPQVVLLVVTGIPALVMLAVGWRRRGLERAIDVFRRPATG